MAGIEAAVDAPVVPESKDVPESTQEGGGRSRTGSRRRRWARLAAVLGVAGAAVIAAAALLVFHGEGRPVPAFPSLAAHPDPSLQGTVAYSTPSRCVRVVAAAGSPSRDVMCLGPWKTDPATAAAGFKEMNSPQLVWRPDGRLEITMFLMQVGPYPGDRGPSYRAEWQKVVDVATGAVEEVPAGQLPPAPNLATRPVTSPTGQTLASDSDPATGQVKVTLSDATGPRTLMSAHGPGEYSYSIHSVFWAPDWKWVAADDGRILVITPGPPSSTRVLVEGDGSGGIAGDIPTFAVTARSLLAGS